MNYKDKRVIQEALFENRMQKSLKRAFWSAIIFVLAASVLGIAGWVSGVVWMKSIAPDWIPMKVFTAVCLILTSTALLLLFLKKPAKSSKRLAGMIGLIIILICLFSAATWFYLSITGREVPFATNPFFNFLFSPSIRMSFLSSFIFIFTGIIVLLLATGKHIHSNIAHSICLILSAVCYAIPIGYFLGIHSFLKIFDSFPAPITGLCYCAVSVAIFSLRSNTWLMRVFTSRNSGGIMLRKLTPWFIILPVVIGYLRIKGENENLFTSETGVLLVAVTYTFCFILLGWFTARSVNRIDSIRQKAIDALKKSYSTMEEKVRERTSELLEVNRALDSEVNERRAAQNLLHSERERMNKLLEIIPAYVILLTPDYHVSYSNRTFRERFGKSDGKHCYEFLFGRDFPCENCETYKVLNDNKTHTWEWTGPDKRVYSIYDYPYTDYDGSPLIMEMGVDVTDLKKAEASLVKLNSELEKKISERTAELRMANERLRILSETSANLLVSENPQEIISALCTRIMNFIDCQVFFNYLSQGSSGMLRLNAYTGIPEEIAKTIENLEYGTGVCGCVASEGKRIIAENIPKNPDPRTDLMKSFGIKAYACHPLFSHNQVIGTLSFGTGTSTRFSDDDISMMKSVADQVAIAITRVRDKELIRKSKEKLDIALETGQIGLWEWYPDTNSFIIDQRMEKMLGKESGTFECTYDAFEKCIHEEDLQHTRKILGQALSEGLPVEIIFRVRQSHNEINYLSTKALVERENGAALKVSGVCFDITGMKKGTEKALFSLNEELLRSNRELEQFAYVASHDLQEPLRMVSSFTQLLSQRYSDRLDKNAQDFIHYAVEGASRMQVLINDLLDYSRISTRTKKYSVIDMNLILGHAVKNLSLTIHEKNALVTNDELPNVVADESQMTMLLQNLIGNSLKFCRKSPKIHISAFKQEEDYLFSIKDNGIGIEKEYFDRIFQIFQRLHPKDEYGGTGIGLAICKRIVESHGGKIWVESKPGRGSVFSFTVIKR